MIIVDSVEPTVSFAVMFQTLLVCRRKAKCRRDSWGEDELVFIQYPDEHSANTHTYLVKTFVEDGKACRSPWVPTQEDIFAENWIIIYEGEPERGKHIKITPSSVT